MRAIRRELKADDTVVTLWFNAWRYEREEHLIVPLLDTLREALRDWAKRPDRDPTSGRSWAPPRPHASTTSGRGEQLQQLVSVLKRLPGNAPAARLQADVEAQLQRVDPKQLDGSAFDTWQRSADELLVRIQTRLREVRQAVSVGPSAAP
jgi:hypothetical protein